MRGSWVRFLEVAQMDNAWIIGEAWKFLFGEKPVANIKLTDALTELGYEDWVRIEMAKQQAVQMQNYLTLQGSSGISITNPTRGLAIRSKKSKMLLLT